ncbi:H-type lectin domain-containing protein, partial [Escherichia coli]|uniref:H-type lectin domain-containing protein n=1 Tax=Escherichia coli TaxID=562 RepID=UPI002150872E|nr:H-type lectin domain-containing protein [Escherichia coli]
NVGTGANQIPDMSLFASSNTATAAAQKFPSGLILQCGQLNGSPNVSSTYGMMFPMTFSRVLAIAVTLNVVGTSGQPTVSATNVKPTGFDITVSPGTAYSASADAYYIAMGY